MFTVKLLHTPELIADASALLYQVYIEELQWKFAPDNPSELRIETGNGRKFLVDRFTEKAVWFGAFENKKLIGCMRLTKPDSNNKFELEGYQSSKIVHKYLPKPEVGVELSKIAVQGKYAGQGVIKRMWLVLFKYCEAHKLSVICTTHNGYLKNMFKRMGFPLVMEHAFKYEPLDPLPVNLYVTDSQKHISDMVYALECLDGDLNPNSSKIFRALELVAPVLPVSTYWHDVNGVVLGVNEHCLNRIGSSYQDIVGKSPYEFYPEHTAEHIVSHNTQVIRSGEIMVQEEWIEDITTGKPKCFSSTKAPLYDDEGTIIGVIGSFVEITGEKEAEKLRLENQAHLTAAEQQEEFKKIVGQMVHDIQSPITTLNTLVQTLSTVEEQTRITIRRAIMNISDITNHMLTRYKSREDNGELSENNQKQSLLVSSVLSDILSEKRYEYKDKSIEFIDEFEDDSLFAFIKVEPSLFRRAISNLINNAVQALYKNDGMIKLKLRVNDEWVFIILEDNGCGIPKDILKKIEEKKAVTANKDDGHGLGLSQVRDMLENNYGTFEIYSRVGNNHGTKVNLDFPRGLTPEWIALEIVLTSDSIVIIVDDDESIHGAWDARLQFIQQKMDKIIIKHFIVGNEALEFINQLSAKDISKVLLLSDYELMGQNLTGLELIKQSKLKNAILVTSHYTNMDVRQMAAKQVVKILPKDLSSKVPIKVDLGSAHNNKDELLNVHMVFVDDQPEVTNSIVNTHYKHLVIDSYTNPYEFLANVDKYPKDTTIFLDNLYFMENRAYDIDGIQIAKQLHEIGYTRLFLLSGENFCTPKYLTLVSKDDKEKLARLDKL
ncbi:MAG: GNAT family N-acetyltransferase [Burkholderiales bacterium]|nr:GNAT family N-acetyltransferase [Burkholderiales bacterium]